MNTDYFPIASSMSEGSHNNTNQLSPRKS